VSKPCQPRRHGQAVLQPQVDVVTFVEDQAEGAGRFVAGRRFAVDLDLPRLQAQDLLPVRRCREPWRKDRRRRKALGSDKERSAR
jgi:hypothetical protein